jgi:hypothetical protein
LTLKDQIRLWRQHDFRNVRSLDHPGF